MLPPTRGTPISILSGLASSPPCTDGLNNTAGRGSRAPRQYPVDGAPEPRWSQGQAWAAARQWGTAGGESPPTADTGHIARAADTKRRPPLPAVLPTRSTHRASAGPLTETGDGQDGTGMGAGDRQARRRKRRGRQRCPMEWFITIPSGRQAAAHELQAPDTSASGACKQCNMVKRKHGATEATRNTERGTRLGPGPGEGPGLPSPAGQDRKNKIRTSCEMPICWVFSFSLS